MGEQTECDKKGKNIHCFYLVKIRHTHQEVENEEAEKQYQLMNLARLRISKEIDIQRGYAYDINRKLAWYSYSDDERIEYKMWKIRNLERYLVKVEPSLPNGFYRLPGNSDRSPVRLDRRRCQERLIKKGGKMDKEYLQQVQEELLSSKKLKGMTSCGTQELNDLILLDDIEKIKWRQIRRNARITRLKAELQSVMKNISCLQREFENVNSKRLKAYKRAYKLGELKKEMKSIYDDYQSLKTQVKELVQKRDVVALKQACDTQVQEFIGYWSGSQAFRDDYQKESWCRKPNYLDR